MIEIGAVRFDRTGVLKEWSTLVDPGVPLPYAIQRLTAIDPAELRAAPGLADLSDELRAFVGSDPLVGQSIEIDVEHLARQNVWLGNPRLDTFELATMLLPRLPTYDLVSIATALGIAIEGRHRALADAHTARQVFLTLVERIGQLDLDVLMHVNRLTTALGWPYAELFADAEAEKRRRLVDDALAGTPVGLMDLGLARVLTPPAEQTEPLIPYARTRRLDTDGLVEALSEGGQVATDLPGYEQRPEQLAMLRAVTDAFNHGKHLIVEAGTGTGKSMAYLLPALAFASANNQRVVVSTNTINLQDQLFDKDVPDLARAMGYGVRASVLKGRSNYLCLRRWLALLRADSWSPAEATLLVKTLLWIGGTFTGDRGELRLTADEEVAWARVCSQSESCSPMTCSYHREGSCFISRARKAAEASHLVIVNHALLLSDLATQSRVMPEYEYLIVDEAHHLEDEATTQLGYDVSLRSFAPALEGLGGSGRDGSGTLRTVVGLLRNGGLDPKRMAQLDNALDTAQRCARDAIGFLTLAFEATRGFVRDASGGNEMAAATVRLTRAAQREGDWIEVEDAWSTARARIDELRRAVSPILEELADAVNAGSESLVDVQGDVVAALHQLELAAEQGQAIMNGSESAVCWATDGTAGPTLHLAPLEVASHIRKWLLDPKQSVVLTSATLSTDGSFGYIRERLGAMDAEELMLGSPFDYERAALLILPRDMPEPNQPGYTRRAAEAIADVAEALGGRTLALFTSYAQLRATHEMLRERMDRNQIVLMAQGIDGPRNRLVQRFKVTERALLLGTASFWEGVDVVGEALSALIIARLPFAVPTDPIVAARSEQFDDPFNQYSVPQAILRFKQGFGRLIRSQTDRGLVVVLDRRLLSKSYGAHFLSSLPPCTVRTVPAATVGTVAGEWLG
ncbi:MAG: ATP-dependent helicase DinG [Chloroflexota bacterium]|nr:ATP-dependent helicase DinG [Chloroflexota bacterium]